MESLPMIGEIAALATAVCWTVTSMSFEVASKRIGSLNVNLLRLFLAFLFLGVFNYFHRGMFLPFDATAHAWFWLVLSGIVGFVIGDLLLFESFTIVGSRISMLIMTLVPPITAIIGWMLLDETMDGKSILGMILTVSGISMAIFGRTSNTRKLRLSQPLKGILLALGGATGQAVGLVLSKFGMGDYDAFAATHIRIIAGGIGFAIVFSFMRRWKRIPASFGDRKAMLTLLLGSIFGPFLGVSLSLYSVQHTVTGIASTIMSIVPILIILPAIVFFKQKITWKEVAGAFVSVVGVSLFFL